MAQNILIVGGVALGSKAACRFKRLEPESHVTIIDQDMYISYGGCGIPFYVSGDVSDVHDLRKTSFHMLRDEVFFKNCKDIDIMTETRAEKIDRESKLLHIRRKDGSTDTLAYDQLVLGTGSSPRRLPIPGVDLPMVYTAANLRDAEAIKEVVTKGQVERAVIIGGGFIGLEMAEALADMWEVETTVVEYCDQIMPGFVSSMFARMAQGQMEEHGVHFYVDEEVKAIEGTDTVTAVVTNKRRLEADLVIMSVGAVPNSDLARDAGLEIGKTGAILVDEHLRTTDPLIYAGGDCAQIPNLVTGQPAYFPLGSMANRQGRVIGTNLAGGNAKFKGAVGSFVVKTFEAALAGAGLSLSSALKAGFDAISVQVAQLDRAHFYPDKGMMYLELVVEKETRRILGIQGFGEQGDAVVGRINTVAAFLEDRPTVDRLSNVELAYSPPFSSAMDILNALGNTAENLLDGRYRPIDVDGFAEKWSSNGDGQCLVLDCRARQDGEPFAKKYPERWINIPQDELRQRFKEIPPGKKLILVCNTGVRSYEAQLNLKEMGLDDPVSVQGGMVTLNKCGLDL
ncbi:pyridine nucleotide-disulfide oxidoreductase [Desulfosarcina ovata subsp. sediminis]|uniref:Pyridine nucleotide-disulfide oxidoreductase n=1 Tax=Desulfosarcina ovata subsp. sediminis TaxID=885957 RepID=A0A5K7ZK49_9BACT|nr:FAD-dependent oxidoreductase [Desulfosarcina ovata]BBO80357.1 pyridine nucleotide-disulfide oxidoreductase [Desulfosarcina ovata subsp. sediminis]